MNQIHVIGGGLAGLAAGLSLTARGLSVVVHEAGPAAGGRCRSYFDKELGLRIDNGNHLLLSGNVAARAYIAEIGAAGFFKTPKQALFPFIDVSTGERWVVHPNKGRIPWWIFRPERRVPETRLSDYLAMTRIVRIRDNTTVADSMRRGRLYERLLEPLAIAALNTPPQAGLARLLGAVMRETLLRGGDACLPMLPEEGLSEALIDPAITLLQARGAEIRCNSRIAELTVAGGKVTALRGPDGPIALDPDDRVVLAVPPWVASGLLPGLVSPEAYEAILNVHFLHSNPAVERAPVGQAAAHHEHAAMPGEPTSTTAEQTGSLVEQAARSGRAPGVASAGGSIAPVPHVGKAGGPVGEAGFIGVIQGVAEWVFVKPGHVSVTISAANAMVDKAAQTIASLVWPNVVDALGLPPDATNSMPVYRVVKEKRATFAATAEQEARRPGARTAIAANLALAGDWTNTGLPATIEGAIRSGRSAADVILSL